MELHQRYSIIGTIGSGDFAIVYKARDLELSREVAIKQIHQQFLADKQKLDSYWKEAELLASLEHPSIMTIYDIVRSQGWLVLELMQGNLKDKTEGKPINVDYLRLAMFHCLHALKFMHANGIIHGDVKPSNMLIDKRNRVKIGDFGLARRVSNDEGSLLKGTTKYMAPEVFSDQFGPVTPASDLYSLGFSAYELLCGDRFDDLFPGLNAFGRDKQLAWVMWHSAADRRLPEIRRVMEGVPEDVQHVIGRLIEKDPKKRYRTADEALADLVHQQGGKLEVSGEDESQVAAAAAARRKRTLVIAAMALSVALSVSMLFIPSGGTTTAPPAPMEAVQGQVEQLNLGQRVLTIKTDGDKFQELKISNDAEIHLNDERVLLGKLQPGDQLLAREEVRDGVNVLLITAARPRTDVGLIRSLQSTAEKMVLVVEEGSERGTALEMGLGHPSEIYLNNQRVNFDELRDGDQVVVVHSKHPTLGRTASTIRATRVVEMGPGQIDNIDTGARQVVISLDGRTQSLTLPFDRDVQVTLNNLALLNGVRLTTGDLQAGDVVRKLRADTQLRSIEAYRQYQLQGRVLNIRPEDGTIDVAAADSGDTLTIRVPSASPLSLGNEKVALRELQIGDTVTVTHDSPDRSTLTSLGIKASREADPGRWSLTLGIEKYDDQELGSQGAIAATLDARRVHQTLVDRYRVPSAQAMLLENTSRIRMEQEVEDFLARVARAQPPASQLIVYFAGHAFLDEDDTVRLAPTDFALRRRSTTGIPLAWLVEALDASPAREKVLLLDSCHPLPEALAAGQPSTEELVARFKQKLGRGGVQTLTIVASCKRGQRGLRLGADRPSLYAETLANAFAGQADQNRDNRLTSAELFEFTQSTMPKHLGPDNQVQHPALFAPDVIQPVFSEEAKQPILQLLAMISLTPQRIELAEALVLLKEAESLASGEPDAKLAYALVLVRAIQLADAQRQFEELKVQHPNLVLAHQGAAYIQFRQGRHLSGLAGLIELVPLIPDPKQGESPPERDLAVLNWSGRLREFAATQTDGRNVPALAQLDAAVALRGATFEKAYEAGRSAVREQYLKYTNDIAASTDSAEQSKLRIAQRQMLNYVDLDLSAAATEIRNGLDRIR